MKKQHIELLVNLNNELIEKCKVISTIYDKYSSKFMEEYYAQNGNGNDELIRKLTNAMHVNVFDYNEVFLMSSEDCDATMEMNYEYVILKGIEYDNVYGDNIYYDAIPLHIIGNFDNVDYLENEIKKSVHFKMQNVITEYENKIIEDKKIKEAYLKEEQEEEYQELLRLAKKYGKTLTTVRMVNRNNTLK